MTSSMRDGTMLYQTAIIDLTERKRAEEAIRQSEKRYRTLFDLVPVAVYTCDAKGLIQEYNQHAVESWGRAPKRNDPSEKFCGSFKIFYPDRRPMPRHKCPMARALRGEKLRATDLEILVEQSSRVRRIVRKAKPYQLEKRYRRKDGASLWGRVSASPLRDAEGKTQSAVAIIIDISDQKKAQAFLEDRARGLEGEILAIRDREQRRIGQDLHDSLCQHLTAIAYMARSVALRLKNHRVIEVEHIEKIAELINDGVTEARTIARGLHPVEMEPPGLVTALAVLVRQPHWPVPCRLEADEEISVPDSTVALHLYRIAREAVINANKYSCAREIIVRMRRSASGIELSVIDDGVGIPANSPAGSGMGFHIMQYRARSIGARL